MSESKEMQEWEEQLAEVMAAKPKPKPVVFPWSDLDVDGLAPSHQGHLVPFNDFEMAVLVEARNIDGASTRKRLREMLKANIYELSEKIENGEFKARNLF